MATKLRSIFFYFEPPVSSVALFSAPNYLVDFFAFVLCPLDSERIRGLQIHYADRTDTVDYVETLVCTRPFDFEKFMSIAIPEREALMLERVCNDLKELGATYSWDLEIIDSAASYVAEHQYRFSGLWANAMSSPSRKHRAEVWLDYSNQPELYLRIYEREMLLVNRLLSVGKAGFDSANAACKKVKWQSEGAVRVYNENLRDYWEYDIANSTLDYIYAPAEAPGGHGKFSLGQMYLDGTIVLHDELRGIKLLRAAAELGYKHAVKKLKSI